MDNEAEAVAFLVKKPGMKGQGTTGTTKPAAQEPAQDTSANALTVQPLPPTIPELEATIVEYKVRLAQVEAILDKEKALEANKEAISTKHQEAPTNGIWGNSGAAPLIFPGNEAPLHPSLEGIAFAPPGKAKIDTLIVMRAEYAQKLLENEELLKQSIRLAQFSREPISKLDEGRMCLAYFEVDRKWYGARIITVNEVDQVADIDWIGMSIKSTVPAQCIKVQKVVDPLKLTAGTFCEALYAGDGQFYPCVIEKVNEPLGSTYVVKFKKYENKETVPLEYMKFDAKMAGKKRLAQQEDEDTLKIPDYLKGKKSDTDAQKLAKKKKVKALKNNFKIKQVEKETRAKQETWHSFKDKATQNKRGYFSKKIDSIFKSPDSVTGRVGVTGSGKGMTTVLAKTKLTTSQNLAEGEEE